MEKVTIKSKKRSSSICQTGKTEVKLLKIIYPLMKMSLIWIKSENLSGHIKTNSRKTMPLILMTYFARRWSYSRIFQRFYIIMQTALSIFWLTSFKIQTPYSTTLSRCLPQFMAIFLSWGMRTSASIRGGVPTFKTYSI